MPHRTMLPPVSGVVWEGAVPSGAAPFLTIALTGTSRFERQPDALSHSSRIVWIASLVATARR